MTAANKKPKQIAIIGCGPAGLFMLKSLLELPNRGDFEITIFEKQQYAGPGMPYSPKGANDEHVTNVSDNEILAIVTPIHDWVSSAPAELLKRFNINQEHFNEYRVLPRLFFGAYLHAQFELLLTRAEDGNPAVHVHTDTEITDVKDFPGEAETEIKTAGGEKYRFDRVIICIGHRWPQKKEGLIPGYYDSPYPPAKLATLKCNHPVAIKGASLTAIDAIKTLARQHGNFYKEETHLAFRLNDTFPDFKIVLHSRSGLLPAVRFHLEDSHLSNKSLLTEQEINAHIKSNNGFLSLDYIFEKDFIEIFRDRDPEFYALVRNMKMEQFVEHVMERRENIDPFLLLKAEYAEAEKSIRRKQSVYWKELLAILSFAMNYPAKHLSAEDMIRLQKVLMPLISVVIAFIPQSSCSELLALHDAKVLKLIAVGNESAVIPERSGGVTYRFKDEPGEEKNIRYQTFIDCIGQPHLSYTDLPFQSLITDKTVSPAKLKFRSVEEAVKESAAGNENLEQGEDGFYYLRVPGLTINDSFRVVDAFGAFNPRIYMMAVPYIGGYNPDYSGLDFCAEAAGRISKAIGTF